MEVGAGLDGGGGAGGNGSGEGKAGSGENMWAIVVRGRGFSRRGVEGRRMMGMVGSEVREQMQG